MSCKFVYVRRADGSEITSYRDFWRMVKLSGFETCEVAEIDPFSNDTYIVPFNYMGWTLPESKWHPRRTAKYILWQLERSNLIDDAYDEIWLSYYGIPELQHPKAKYVPFGGHKDFCVPVECDKLFDFYHMCYLPGRRAGMVRELQSRGYSIAPCPEDFEAKNLLLQQSRYGLCLHQDELQYIEPIRYTVFSMYHLPLFAEYSPNTRPYFVFSYEAVALGTNLNGIDFSETARRNFNLLTTELSFENCVKKALI